MNTTSGIAFGPLLRRRRFAAGLTQEELAERAGLSVRAIQRLERDHTAPRAETVRLLADALGLSAEERSALVAATHPELAAPPTAATARGNAIRLPVPPTPLVGRERDVAAACALLCRPEVRLLTLTGPGGVGKTRLALAVATELAGGYSDDPVWVELAPLRDPDLFGATLAHACGARETDERPLAAALAASVANRRVLLVLDNLEHLLPASPLIAELLAAAPSLKVLATSRARLRLRGERELSVAPLAVPTAMGSQSPVEGLAGVPAVRLFVKRAADVRPDFALTAENAEAVAAIVRRLEGLPLALELAAARVKVLPLPELLERLEQRLPLLSSGARDLPPRQQTMGAAIAWSYDLLTGAEQALFRRVAVFAGGFTVEAAATVAAAGDGTEDGCLDILEGLAALVDQSLLRPQEQPGGNARFALLETVREYALERLEASGEIAAVRHAHAGFYLGLAERAEPELTGPGQTEWLDRLEIEHDNLRAALGWALEQEPPTSLGVRLAGALWRFWWMHGHYHEGQMWLEAALEAHVGAEAERAKALYGAGSLATEQGAYERATALLEAALDAARIAGDRSVAALALTDLGSIARQQGAYERASHFHGEALALRREDGDARGIAVSLANLGLAALYQGAYRQAENLLSEAASIFRDQGDQHSLVTAMSNLARAAVFRGDYDRARGLVEESLAGYRAMGDSQGTADDLLTLGMAVQGQGNRDHAAVLFSEALEHARAIGYRLGEAAALYRLGQVALVSGEAARAFAYLCDSLRLVDATEDYEVMAGVLEGLALVAALPAPERAARLMGAAAALRETVGAARPSTEQALHQHAVAAVRRALGEPAFASAMAAGRALPLEAAVAEALAAAD